MERQDAKEAIKKLRSYSSRDNIAGMERFGISTANTLGVPIPRIRGIAKDIGTDHRIALELWNSGIHEARILASMVDNPDMVTGKQMDKWAGEFDSWDICDQCCGNLFSRTRLAYEKAQEWSKREEEYVKRAGFALMAAITVHDKKRRDDDFVKLLAFIERESTDERNFVKKAVNWALRQIGKRNKILNKQAIAAARRISAKNSKSARWIASDAIRELTSRAVQVRLDGD
jgi:3-methyladenine DNA glycosylase AlkD